MDEEEACRQQQLQQRMARMANAIAALMAMPAMAPGERRSCRMFGVESGVLVGEGIGISVGVAIMALLIWPILLPVPRS